MEYATNRADEGGDEIEMPTRVRATSPTRARAALDE
jgi:hypothetical protein